MKVSKRDISILLIVLGLIGAFSVFQFYFRGKLKEKKSLEDDSKNLQARLDKYYDVDENKVKAAMKAHVEEIEADATKYPAAYLYEDIIMYMNGWQELPYEEIYNFPAYEVSETEITSTVSGVIDWDATNLKPIETTYMFSKAQLQAEYGTNSYKGFKDLINKIYLDAQGRPMTVKAVSAQMDATNGIISGELVIDFFNVQNGKNTYTGVDISDVKTGVEKIFGPTVTPTPTPTPSVDPKEKYKLPDND